MTTLISGSRSPAQASMLFPRSSRRVFSRHRASRVVEHPRRRFLAAQERLVGPGVVPIAVAAAIADADVAQIAVHDGERGGAVVVVDYIGVAVDRRVLEQDLVALADEAAALQVGDR